ncbi:cytosine/adenosine deaminase-related metal-dependent hydrolase [Dokdonella fugitiva]|uniref:Cytosine/adenosine deaminase-related metal-dependent hydrolase n=1 Tax=Dokdonella fugitiva TaxID=328517 RepID=A0A839EWU6_9GAMM|nr:amidohydrolase family protein [Dokdonella fugitiva]MBA8887103.1 cytosine/adenosine deaminase-related metal-dependent hydrolase [Dokdonella fugitiva]
MLRFLAAALLAACGAHAAVAATRTDTITIQGNAAGTQTVDAAAGGRVHAEYAYNDRGRGDHITADWTLDDAGRPTRYEGRGNDYMKAPVEEHFSIAAGTASWHSRTERGEAPAAGAFYVPNNAPPEFLGVLARALLKAPDHRLALLPAGEASIEAQGSVQVDGRELHHYRITGLGFTPQPIWLDGEGATAAIVSGWFSVVPAALAKGLEPLQAAQEAADNAWSARLARELVRAPKGGLLIRDARVFDPRDLSVSEHTSVLVRGERVVRVAPDAALQAVADAEVLDAHGRFLMPGLWDNHQHFSDVDGLLDLANGVTSARDMANDTDAFLKRVARFDDGSEIGPRVLKAGIIDGTGEFAGPTKMRVDSAEDAIKDVDWYADHGYVQIKIYSSIKPELMPLIAARAHERGLRVSGHVPALMSARQFVEGGADEIQHLNFVVLNFLFPGVQETRNRDRFIKVAEHARAFTPDKPEVREFVAFLKAHHTVLDPTMTIFEDLFSGDPTAITPGLETLAPRLPPQVRRAMFAGALPVPKGQEEAYRAAFPAMLALLKSLHDAGVTIIPGTDALAGYQLHHELELYAKAGIAPAEVLRMATLVPAEVMGVTRDRGAIAPGKYADLLLVDGDPSRDITDIRKVATVVKGGKVYDPAAIERALGILPRPASP